MNFKQVMYSALAAVLALALMYLDTKLLDNPKSKPTYVKGMLMTGTITWFVLYLMDCIPSSSQYLRGIDAEMLTGPPDF